MLQQASDSRPGTIQTAQTCGADSPAGHAPGIDGGGVHMHDVATGHSSVDIATLLSAAVESWVGLPGVEELVIYGLGSPEDSRVSRYQVCLSTSVRLMDDR